MCSPWPYLQPVCSGLQQKCLICASIFLHKSLKRQVLKGEMSIDKVNHITALLKTFLSEAGMWMIVNDTQFLVPFGATSLIVLRCRQFYPSLLLQVQGKRQHLEKDKWWLSEHDRTGVPWKDLRDSQNSWIHIENCCPREIIANINWVT